MARVWLFMVFSDTWSSEPISRSESLLVSSCNTARSRAVSGSASRFGSARPEGSCGCQSARPVWADQPSRKPGQPSARPPGQLLGDSLVPRVCRQVAEYLGSLFLDAGRRLQQQGDRCHKGLKRLPGAGPLPIGGGRPAGCIRVAQPTAFMGLTSRNGPVHIADLPTDSELSRDLGP